MSDCLFNEGASCWRCIQQDFDTADAVSAPKKIKSKKIKVCSNLKWLGSALSAFSSTEEVLNSNIFGPSVPIIWRIRVKEKKTKKNDWFWTQAVSPKNLWIRHWLYQKDPHAADKFIKNDSGVSEFLEFLKIWRSFLNSFSKKKRPSALLLSSQPQKKPLGFYKEKVCTCSSFQFTSIWNGYS